MRALIRRIVDHILGCRPKQVARRRDLYGWSGPTYFQTTGRVQPCPRCGAQVPSSVFHMCHNQEEN